MVCVTRKFFHYGQWFHSFINLNKLVRLGILNEHTAIFSDFITQTIIDKTVPNHFFTDEAHRCSSVNGIMCEVEERPSRFKRIVERALERQGNRQRHYVVLKALVESPETDIVCCELPVWLPHGERVGHIDAIELADGNPSIFVWDYKPMGIEEDASGQISTYKMILAQMLKVPWYEVGAGWFNEIEEVILIE